LSKLTPIESAPSPSHLWIAEKGKIVEIGARKRQQRGRNKNLAKKEEDKFSARKQGGRIFRRKEEEDLLHIILGGIRTNPAFLSLLPPPKQILAFNCLKKRQQKSSPCQDIFVRVRTSLSRLRVKTLCPGIESEVKQRLIYPQFSANFGQPFMTSFLDGFCL